MRRAAIATAVLVALAAGGVVAWQARGGESTSADDEPTTFVIAPVERRSLVDEMTVRGQIRREELQRITSPIEGQVSSLLVGPGDTIEPGDTIMALSGRAAVAVEGDFSFFRQLDVGSEGPDVRQLEDVLDAAGYDVGDVDERFTEATRSGLARWQADRGYGGASPESDESITVALQGAATGYTVGALGSIGIIVEPLATATPSSTSAPPGIDVDPPSTETAMPPDAAAPAATTRVHAFAARSRSPRAPQTVPADTVPAIEVVVNPTAVVEGDVATFTFRSDIAPAVATTVDYVVGGDAIGGDDYIDDLSGSFVFPAGATTVELVVTTLTDDVIEVDEELVVTVGNGINVNPDERYRPGALKEARLRITSAPGEVPAMSVRNDQDAINEGAVAQFVVAATQARNEATTVRVRLSGSAAEGADYEPVDREIELPAGATEVTIAVATVADRRVEPDEYLVVSLEPTDRYTVRGDAADVVIESNDVPELTLEGGGTIGEGDVTVFAIEADQAPVVDTAVNYLLGGSATPGTDYETLSGTVVLPAGQRRIEITVRTIDDDVVFRPGDMIVADWPARVGTVSVDEGEFILLGSEVLTLTEPSFTITLQLSPTDRSNLAVGLEASVELQASAQSAVPGVITELDDSATIDQSGAETYSGVVETTGTLEAVDGASVNVDVVLERRDDVITVPVASVLQDGQGRDVVRIVLEDGTTRQVTVTTGLSEGAFVEIREGLDGDELVLVET